MPELVEIEPLRFKFCLSLFWKPIYPQMLDGLKRVLTGWAVGRQVYEIRPRAVSSQLESFRVHLTAPEGISMARAVIALRPRDKGVPKSRAD